MRRYTEEQKSTIILDSEWYRANVLAADIEEVYDYIDRSEEHTSELQSPR